MNISTSTHARQAGFTLGETMVAIGMAAVVATAATYVFLNGTILYAKNTGTNLAHDQNRIAVSRLVQDIHAAVSMPKLGRMVQGTSTVVGSWKAFGTNVSFEPVSGTGPAAGISFKKMGNSFDPNGGPFRVWNDPAGDLIQIESGRITPYVGMELVFPYYDLEGEITKVTGEGVGASRKYQVWAEDLAKTRIDTRVKNKTDTLVICYYMSRYAYVVENGQLRLYSAAPPPLGVTWPVVVARNIINEANRANAATPFTQPDPDYVGVNLTTEDNRYSNRKFKAVNTLLAGSVPIRAKLSKKQ